MGLRPAAAALVGQIPPRPPRRSRSLAENRAGLLALRPQFGSGRRLNTVRDMIVKAEDRNILTRVYVPSGLAPHPCLVFAHGGGWVLGDLETHDSLCRNIAALAGCAIVSVDYRRAPEFPFPAGLHDVEAVVDAVFRDGPGMGIDTTRVAVGGDSAGGNLAAVVCQRRRHHDPALVHQLLLLPVVDAHPESWPSYQTFSASTTLSADDMDWYFEQYLRASAELRDDPAVAPYRQPDLAGLAPATIVVAECDVLRDEGEAYAGRLDASGVPTALRRYSGMFHPFYLFTAALPDARDVQWYAAARLREAFGTEQPRQRVV